MAGDELWVILCLKKKETMTQVSVSSPYQVTETAGFYMDLLFFHLFVSIKKAATSFKLL